MKVGGAGWMRCGASTGTCRGTSGSPSPRRPILRMRRTKRSRRRSGCPRPPVVAFAGAEELPYGIGRLQAMRELSSRIKQGLLRMKTYTRSRVQRHPRRRPSCASRSRPVGVWLLTVPAALCRAPWPPQSSAGAARSSSSCLHRTRRLPFATPTHPRRTPSLLYRSWCHIPPRLRLHRRRTRSRMRARSTSRKPGSPFDRRRRARCWRGRRREDRGSTGSAAAGRSRCARRAGACCDGAWIRRRGRARRSRRGRSASLSRCVQHSPERFPACLDEGEGRVAGVRRSWREQRQTSKDADRQRWAGLAGAAGARTALTRCHSRGALVRRDGAPSPALRRLRSPFGPHSPAKSSRTPRRNACETPSSADTSRLAPISARELLPFDFVSLADSCRPHRLAARFHCLSCCWAVRGPTELCRSFPKSRLLARSSKSALPVLVLVPDIVETDPRACLTWCFTQTRTRQAHQDGAHQRGLDCLQRHNARQLRAFRSRTRPETASPSYPD